MILTTLSLSLPAGAGPDPKPEEAQFRLICREFRKQALHFKIEAPEIGGIAFLPILALEGTQNRFSYRRFLDAMYKALSKHPETLFYDSNRSVFGIEKRIRAVFYQGKLFVIDGHHRALISTYSGAQTIPVLIVDDLSHLPLDDFRQTMEERGWAYWRDHLDQRIPPVDLCEMRNDSNFLLARRIIMRAEAKLVGDKMIIGDWRGADWPVALKINGDIPFFENHIADALRRGHVEYDESRSANDFSKKELQQYSAILQEEAKWKTSPLSKVLLLDKPWNMAKPDLELLILQHLRKMDCEKDLASRLPKEPS